MTTRTPVQVSTVEAARTRLRAVDQEHLLTFYNDLDGSGQRGLLEQIATLDIEALPRLVEEYVRGRPACALPHDVQPAHYYKHDHLGLGSGGGGWERDAYRRRGQELIRAGKVAAFVVAGGQGSRLGYEGPKGCYPAGAVTDKPLFAIFADALLGARRRYGVDIPWYIMTSPLNHDSTVQYFEAHSHFGLEPRNVRFFAQGVLPSFDMRSGRVLLAERGIIATNPDGHGGSLKALWESESIHDMKRRGVEIISYFQVDNPIVNVIDPVFIGLHASAPDSSGQMSSKMVPKLDPGERVGVFCAHGAGPLKGRVEVIEYSDLPAALAQQRTADHALKFCAGSIAVHVLGVEFVERLNTDAAFRLPLHRAEKRIPHVDVATGEAINPATNNGVKLEAFVFDALPLCERSVVLETDRVEEFAPIKNASGADSAQTCREIQTLRAARWLRELGVDIPERVDGAPDCVLEVSPRTATSAAELKAALGGEIPRHVERGARVVL